MNNFLSLSNCLPLLKVIDLLQTALHLKILLFITVPLTLRIFPSLIFSETISFVLLLRECALLLERI